jgi:lantibiotic modifying enzyme
VLYRPEDFEPLVDEPWDAALAREGIREIVADTETALRGPKLLWPADTWDAWRATSPLKDLYVGAAGVLWALADLRDRGHAEPRVALDELALHALERQRTRPDLARWTDLPEPRESALLSGEAGVLLTAYRLAPSAELADALYARVRANVENDAEDVMWGAPGSLVAARLLLEWTGEERWRRAIDELVTALLARRAADGLWTQAIQGQTFRGLGPVHGLVGNVKALLPVLDEERRSDLVRDTSAVLRRTAFIEGQHANWPPVDREILESRVGDIRLQWCHGAPGIVTSSGSYLDEELLLAGAELTWSAGAHRDEKGASICHGTAGNGYALLAAFERTGDELWLSRARRLALHALAQARRQRAARGRGRYSLFTGDLGVALYVAACLDARAGYPVLGA